MKITRNMKLRLLALLLTVSVLSVGTEIPVYAEEVRGKETNWTAGGPENPVYDATTDTTKWSYIYFGNYPQTEVKGSSLTSAIKNASYNSDGDAMVNGIKYRRISQEDVSSNSWSEDGVGESQYRYFKWERIRWRVLQNNGTELYILADQGLDSQTYNAAFNTATTWEKCSLRSWFNNTFYTTAFTLSERSSIIQQTVTNENNPYYGTSAGNGTSDIVYALSMSEVTNPKYGFCGDYAKLSKSRLLGRSDYARAMGAYCTNGADGRPNCTWWLRTPGSNTQQALFADTNGKVPEGGWTASDGYRACVPALHIKLSSTEWRIAPVNPVYDKSSDTTEWSYVYFGSYPQTEITGAALTSEIVNASYDNQGDAWVDNKRYRRIRKIDANNGSNFGTNEYRYFKWEYIRWRVLQNDGETLYVMADQALDCKNYNEEAEPVTWESCTLRSWLNNTFYNIAFTAKEQESCVNVQQTGGDAGDKVSLLSFGEAYVEKYGFGSGISKSRNLQMSDYAYRMGAGKTRADSEYGEVSAWWLRLSGGSASKFAACACYGQLFENTEKVEVSSESCVPTLRIKLSSSSWITDNSFGSGTGGTIPINVNIEYSTYNNKSEVGFSATVSGGTSSAYTYQWYYVDSVAVEHTKISGATQSYYKMPADSVTEDMGNRYYYCVITDGSYSAVSNKLKCSLPIEIIEEPEDCQVVFGEKKQLEIAVRTPVDDITCVWYRATSPDDAGTPIGNYIVDSMGGISVFFSPLISSDEIEADSDSTNYYCVLSNDWYSVTSRRAKLSVIEYIGVSEVSVTPARAELTEIGEQVVLTAQIYPQNAANQDVTWFSSDTNIATVSLDGMVTAVATGTATIYAVVDDGKSAEAQIVVKIDGDSGEAESEVTGSGESERGTERPETSQTGESEVRETQKPGSSETGTEPSSQRPEGSSETAETQRPGSGETGTESPSQKPEKPDEKESETLENSQTSESEVKETQKPGSSQKPEGSSETGTEPSSQKPAKPGEVPGKPDETETATERPQNSQAGEHGQPASEISGTQKPESSEGKTQPNEKPDEPNKTPPAKLSVPVLKVTLRSVNSVKLTWKKVNGAKGYTIYRAVSKKGKYSKLKSVAGTSYTDKKLKKGKTYYYKIEAYNGSASSAKSASVSKKIIGSLSTPKQNIIKFNSSYTQFTVSWKPVKNAQKIEILLSTDNGAYKVWKTVSAGKGKAVYLRSSLKKGHRYSFAVRAYYKQDGKKICSSRSNSFAFSL